MSARPHHRRPDRRRRLGKRRKKRDESSDSARSQRAPDGGRDRHHRSAADGGAGAHVSERRVPQRPPLRGRQMEDSDARGAGPRGGRGGGEGGRGGVVRAARRPCDHVVPALLRPLHLLPERTAQPLQRRGASGDERRAVVVGRQGRDAVRVGGVVLGVHADDGERGAEDPGRLPDGGGGSDRVRRDDGRGRGALHGAGAGRRGDRGDRMRRGGAERDSGAARRWGEPDHRRGRAGQQAGDGNELRGDGHDQRE